MGETHQYRHHHDHHQQQPSAATTSRVGMRNLGRGGEIIQVQGGHIVRSTGRKDRHSKVCTAKGPRDRRVRLSAHTAIQFYDVQDRLGYDRSSKAVDWLIKKAKPAIDQLAKPPPWKPNSVQREEEKIYNPQQEENSSGSEKDYNCNNIQMDSFQIGNQNQQLDSCSGSGFLPPSLDSDAIADTIKTFFPMGASGSGETDTSPSGTSMQQFQAYPTPDLLSRTSNNGGLNQDLRLSLQSFQEPHHVLFPGPNSGASAHYLGGGFEEPSSSTSGEQHRFQRMLAAWNTAGCAGSGFFFNSVLPPPQTAVVQPVLISQGGPLQSSNSPLIRAWIDPGVGIADQFPQFHPGMGFSGGFSGFRVPARIQGDQEEHGGIHNKPSSASSDSRH